MNIELASYLLYFRRDLFTIKLLHKYFFCVHYLCLIGRVYVFYVGRQDYETLFRVVILSKHHHYDIGEQDEFWTFTANPR
jgi:Ni,Fe-hydrogenase I cytochrome b subunit